ncbi:PqiC family protein [Cupriavidus taiwanensis]|uniref:Putative lipoprotein n=1 Tax=Cupriavidus taiwanensis TaxID=164546 RepID=A0A375GWF2_9BURK|nr:PqiC family protein [Cupriavidus taiwanensis]SOY55531.1 putative lipoprotein [Cupriavidus taiwanensis]SOY55701.1 putative lipoprotein [Cupriavidus taiwanensis]SOY90544.1 putative lipoprotein [Cupriavidus taiwanensis]SOZ25067.1 putative lipoprotein [Cupriavidus taiwanensis]SOZ61864.1 putative lipoprotein [Cupriavidus taiwanensis]
MMKRLPLTLLCAGAAAAVLAGCASPEPRYYTLAQGPTAVAAPAPAAAPSADPLWLEVAPVRVPERLNRPQLVVRDGQDGSGGDAGVRLLDLSRWSSPLPDELRDALSQRLQATLGAVDTYQQGLSDVQPLYRITTEVLRLDADVGQRAGATINWTVRRLPDGKVVSGRTQAELPAPGAIDGVVAAYREIVASTANDIAAGVQSLRR